MNIIQLGSQVILMFCLMLVGILINKVHFMSATTSNDLTNILLYIVSPCLIIQAFEQPYSHTRIHEFYLSMLGMLIIYVVSISLANLIFAKVKDKTLKATSIYGSIFSNVGFMGVPIAAALFGKSGVFFAVVSLVGFNLFNWTYGVSIFQKGHARIFEQIGLGLKKALLNPNITAIVIGFLMFINSFKIPNLINHTILEVSSVNTPLSMIIIGNSLANVKFRKKDFSLPLWISLLLRNLLFPILSILILQFCHVSGIALLTTIIMCACPTAGLVVLFTLQANENPASSIALMSLSTILSVATIPLVAVIANLI